MTELHPKRRGRTLALLTLCHLESYPVEERAEAIDVLWSAPPDGSEIKGLLGHADARRFARRLLDAFAEHGRAIDEALERGSQKWRPARMDSVDRNILRLGLTEQQHGEPVPAEVLLSEAVALAARYGASSSARFVNGVLKSVLQG